MANIPSLKDAQQVLRYAFEDDTNRLRVDAVISPDGHDLEIHYTDDSIAIGDPSSGNILKINADGSIPVTVSSVGGGIAKSFFNELLSVAANSTVTLNSYTVPAGTTASLQKIVTSGQNIAEYTVFVNGAKFDMKRTYFGGIFNIDFDYADGVIFPAGTVITVQAFNYRPSSANFECRIQVVENN